MTKIKYILLLIGCLAGLNLQAQTLVQAKELYKNGEYQKAKPVFKKYVKSQSGNGNYHLWYGVCCLHTEEPDLAVKHLEIAVKKRIPSGQLFLGQAYASVYRYQDAIHVYEDYIADLTKRKRSTQTADSLLQHSKLGARLLKGVEEVCFVDSFVVDKKDFLKAYKLSPESGKLYTYEEYFEDNSETEGTVYETELGNKLYYAQMQQDSTISILSCNKMQDQWGKGHLLPGAINEAINANYPYVMTDGITIYYAADGPQSLGGYDIFVTRYNMANDTYLTPQNVGMPFNSPANDYMYVIDEFNNLGWFASDRYQPEDKVCIYLFIPNASKQVYSYEQTEPKKLLQLAKLHSIQETWTDNQTVEEARQRLLNVLQMPPVEQKRPAFEFVINDQHIYHKLSDFQSENAKQAFNTYVLLEKSDNQLKKKLETLRLDYLEANETDKKKLTPVILDLEKRIEQLATEKQQAAMQVRQLELQSR